MPGRTTVPAGEKKEELIWKRTYINEKDDDDSKRWHIDLDKDEDMDQKK